MVRDVEGSTAVTGLIGGCYGGRDTSVMFVGDVVAVVPTSLFCFGSGIGVSNVVCRVCLCHSDGSSLLLGVVSHVGCIILSGGEAFTFIFVLGSRSDTGGLGSVCGASGFGCLASPCVSLGRRGVSVQECCGVPSSRGLLVRVNSLREEGKALIILSSVLGLPRRSEYGCAFFFTNEMSGSVGIRFCRVVGTVRSIGIIIGSRFYSCNFFTSLYGITSTVLLPCLLSDTDDNVVKCTSRFGAPMVTASAKLVNRLIERCGLNRLLPAIGTSSLVCTCCRLSGKLLGGPSGACYSARAMSGFGRTVISVVSYGCE